MAFYEGIIHDKNGDEVKQLNLVSDRDGNVYKVFGVSGNVPGAEVLWVRNLETPDFKDVFARDITIVKPKETFDEVAKALKYEASQFDIDECRAFGKRFLTCKEASHEN